MLCSSAPHIPEMARTVRFSIYQSGLKFAQTMRPIEGARRIDVLFSRQPPDHSSQILPHENCRHDRTLPEIQKDCCSLRCPMDRCCCHLPGEPIQSTTLIWIAVVIEISEQCNKRSRFQLIWHCCSSPTVCCEIEGEMYQISWPYQQRCGVVFHCRWYLIPLSMDGPS
jgi:hypothetical protein